MKRRFLQLCSFLLSVILFVQLLPLNVLAAQPETTQAAQEQAPDVYILGEIPQRRDRYTKEYLLSNGLRLATVHGQPIHYEDQGQWKEIDNTLKAASLSKTVGYTNTAGAWSVHFPSTLSDSSAVTITQGQNTLRFRLTGALEPSGDAAVLSQTAQPTEPIEATA